MPGSGRRYPTILSGRWAIIGLFVLAFIAALRVGSSLVLPIVWAGMLALLLAPAVNWLARHRVPPALAAGLVLIALLGSVGTAVSFLAGPATAWIDRAPQTLRQAERKLRTLTKGLEQLQETAEAVEDVTQGGTQRSRAAAATGAAPASGLFAKLSGTTVAFAGALATVVFLTYFLLAMGHRFREKLDDILAPGIRGEVSEAIAEMQQQMSRYLAVSTGINAGVGLLTTLVMMLVGMPNPALWGVMAGVLNFIPYLGALITIGVIFLAGLVSLDTTGQAFLAAGAFFLINLVEANIITPLLMGRRLPLNPVAIFGGLLFWGWLWGMTGAILAVPLMACMKVMADRIEPLKPLGEMLGP